MTVVHLVRHTAVARYWSGRCYGKSDVPLSREGRDAARALAASIARIGPRLAECHFGAWEGLPWDAIYAESGDAMMGLVTAPHVFRPGGDGETTFAMRDRAMAWLHDVVGRREAGAVVAICHGGPIAAIRGTLSNAPVSEWPSLVPRYGEIVPIEVRFS